MYCNYKQFNKKHQNAQEIDINCIQRISLHFTGNPNSTKLLTTSVPIKINRESLKMHLDPFVWNGHSKSVVEPSATFTDGSTKCRFTRHFLQKHHIQMLFKVLDRLVSHFTTICVEIVKELEMTFVLS